MENYLSFSLTVFAGFFAIMNPVGGIPVFLSLTEGATTMEKNRIAKKATVVAFLIGLAFMIFGTYLFKFFGITIPAFKITGGLILFYTGFEMLQSKKSGVKHLQDPQIDENIAVSPLAIPLLAGPGTIVTGMNFVSKTDYSHIAVVILIFLAICYLNYMAFRLSDKIIEKTGDNIITVFGKIMGLIIAIIGVDMVVEGIKIAFNLN
ncbi:MAG: MarC family protein [Flavobacteriia bacterium]|nr:MAG: MarC family protein [Flavobacteriia bacterium]